MPKKIQIVAGDLKLAGELEDNPTADGVAQLLPVTLPLQRSAGELFVEIELDVAPEKHARNRMRVGELGYWAPGRTLSFFCGPTRLSAEKDDTPIATSAVTPIGTFEEPDKLLAVAPDQSVTISLVE